MCFSSFRSTLSNPADMAAQVVIQDPTVVLMERAPLNLMLLHMQEPTLLHTQDPTPIALLTQRALLLLQAPLHPQVQLHPQALLHPQAHLLLKPMLLHMLDPMLVRTLDPTLIVLLMQKARPMLDLTPRALPLLTQEA